MTSTFVNVLIALHIWCICLFTVSCLMDRGPATFRGFHHFYIGMVLTVVAYFTKSQWLLFVGVLIEGDDTWQHAYQVMWSDYLYRSPLNRLYELVYNRIPWVASVNRWLDGLFGRR